MFDNFPQLKFLWVLLQVVISISFWFPVLLFCLKKNRKSISSNRGIQEKEYDFAVIVTAYQQTDLLPDVVNAILNTGYENLQIYVVADNCDVSSLYFDSPKVTLFSPETVLASNIRSHLYAIERLVRDHDLITIIDSDNIVQKDYFRYLNDSFNAGYEAVQGVRAARNLNTLYARLDEAGDIFYRYIDRKLLFEAGSSASLAGSGMAFTTSLYKQFLKKFDISGAGFDKLLQYELVANKYVIAFCENAILLDAKTAKSDQLVKQRARWINTWFRYWKLAGKLLIKSIINLNWNQFAFSIMLLRPPLFLLFSVAFVFMLLNIFIMPLVIIFWLFMLVLFTATFYKALSHFKADISIYHSLVQAPKFVCYQFIALFKAKKANRISVATKHDASIYKSN